MDEKKYCVRTSWMQKMRCEFFMDGKKATCINLMDLKIQGVETSWMKEIRYTNLMDVKNKVLNPHG